MQHTLQISRKIDYALRAMIYLASTPAGEVASIRAISQATTAPAEFLAKILKLLAKKGLVQATRGVRGGYALARPRSRISFLDVIEAVEGPVVINMCLDRRDRCTLTPSCTMYAVWKLGQERMLEVYRSATLDKLATQRAPA